MKSCDMFFKCDMAKFISSYLLLFYLSGRRWLLFFLKVLQMWVLPKKMENLITRRGKICIYGCVLFKLPLHEDNGKSDNMTWQNTHV